MMPGVEQPKLKINHEFRGRDFVPYIMNLRRFTCIYVDVSSL